MSELEDILQTIDLPEEQKKSIIENFGDVSGEEIKEVVAESEKLEKSAPSWTCGCQDSKEKKHKGILKGEQKYHWNFMCPVCCCWFCIQKKEIKNE